MLWLLLDYSKRIHYSEIMYNKGDAYDKEKGIDIIGVPSTFGQRKLGVDLGPTAIRYAGLIPRLKQLDLDVNDKGILRYQL